MSGQKRPSTVITWATETNYPAGSNPWNGQPCKTSPVGDIFIPGTLAQGGTKVPAEWLNELFNKYSAAIQAAQDWCGNSPALNWWSFQSASTVFGGSGTAVQAVRWEDASTARQFLATGYYNDGVTDHARTYVTSDLGQTWSAAATGDIAADASGFAGTACVVDPNASNYLAMATGRSGTITVAKAAFGGAWASSTTYTVTGHGAVGACTISTAAVFAYVNSGATASAFVYSTNSGTSWSTFSPAVTPNEWLLVSNGSQALALGVGTSLSVCGSYYTSTNGTSWTLESLPAAMAAGDQPTGLAWTVDAGGACWIMSVTQSSSSNTQFYRSPDGVTWTQVASGAAHLFQVYDLAAVGALLIATINPQNANQTGPSRVYFSVDGGTTWYPSPHTISSNQNASSFVGWSRNRCAASDVGFIMGNTTGVRLSQDSGLPDVTA